MRVSIKHNIIRYSMIVLLIGSVALGAGRADERHPQQIELSSVSFGITPGLTARISMGLNAAFADGSVRFVKARIQLLDTEGEVGAQSDEIRVEPGKMRFWDAPYEQIGGVREPGTGRIQLRARILFEERSFDRDPLYNPFITVEAVDSSTGVTVSIHNEFSYANFRLGQ